MDRHGSMRSGTPEGTTALDPDGAAARPIYASSVLILDDDPLRRAALACNVLRTGVVLVLSASPGECRSISAVLAPNVVVGMPGPQRELVSELAHLLRSSPRTMAIVIGVPGVEEIAEQVPEAARRLYGLPVPAPPHELAQLIRKHCPARGIAGPFTPAEYVQQAGLGGHSVALHCVDSNGLELGVILISRGHVHSARCEGARGFDAFAALVTRSDARVVLGELSAPDTGADADLVDHWQALILEAMRRHDEREHSSVASRSAARQSDTASFFSEPPSDAQREALTRAASIPVMPVTEMREALGSTRGSSRPDVRALVEQGVRAVIEQDYPRAIDTLERALAADPRNTSVRHRLDRLYAIVAGRR